MLLGDAISQFDPLYDSRSILPENPFYLPSRIDGIGALFLQSETMIRGGLAGDVLRIAQRGYDAAFARDADLGAVLLFHFEPNQKELDGRSLPSSLFVFDFEGRTSFRSTPTLRLRGYSQLYLSNDGSWAMVTQQGPDLPTIGTDEVVFIDTVSGETAAVPGMSGGARLHSMDGRYFVLFQSGWEKVHLFDMSTPAKPQLTWLRQGFGGAAASINADGSLVAVMGMSLVTVIDRSGRVVAEAPRHVENGFGGLMFAGDFLVVGMQAHTHHGFEEVMDVTRIDMYDVGMFR